MVKFTQNGKTQFLNRDKFRSLVVGLKTVAKHRKIDKTKEEMKRA